MLSDLHLVVEMPYEQRLCCESVGLDIDIGPRDVLKKAGFADIGVAANDQRASIGINGG